MTAEVAPRKRRENNNLKAPKLPLQLEVNRQQPGQAGEVNLAFESGIEMPANKTTATMIGTK